MAKMNHVLKFHKNCFNGSPYILYIHFRRKNTENGVELDEIRPIVACLFKRGFLGKFSVTLQKIACGASLTCGYTYGIFLLKKLRMYTNTECMRALKTTHINVTVYAFMPLISHICLHNCCVLCYASLICLHICMIYIILNISAT